MYTPIFIKVAINKRKALLKYVYLRQINIFFYYDYEINFNLKRMNFLIAFQFNKSLKSNEYFYYRKYGISLEFVKLWLTTKRRKYHCF